MPLYPNPQGSYTWVSNNKTKHLNKGDMEYLFGAHASNFTQEPVNDTNVTFETTSVVANAVLSSTAVNIQAGNEASPAPSISIELHYNGAPGSGESVAVQEADTDADLFYITPTNSAYTIASATAQFSRSDLSPTGGRFVRLQRTVGANAVGMTAKISRLG
jgi:hypothetical protein